MRSGRSCPRRAVFGVGEKLLHVVLLAYSQEKVRFLRPAKSDEAENCLSCGECLADPITAAADDRVGIHRFGLRVMDESREAHAAEGALGHGCFPHPGCERSVKIKSLETTKINQN